MGRRKKNRIVEQVSIVDIGSEGKSVGKKDDLVIFVAGCVPGDVVDVKITRKKPSYSEGVVYKYVEYSSDRIEAFCEHYGTCGGCKWQSLTYDKQLEYKQLQVQNNLKKIARIPLPETLPIIGSKKTEYYRNKLEFTFTSNRWLTNEEINSGNEFERRGLGMHLPKRFDKVLDLNHCHLQQEPSDKIRLAIKDYAIQKGYSFFDIRDQYGFLRTLMIRTSTTGDLMVLLQFFENNEAQIEDMMSFVKDTFPEITSLMYVHNPKGNDTLHDLTVKLYNGKPYILEEMEGLQFRVGPKSFYQTNSEQAYELYKITRDLAQLTGEEVVYDLYTGTGTIANFIAKSAKSVIGMEYVPMAIEDAKVNSEINKIDNTQFYAGDIKDLLNDDFLSSHPQADVIITDPPRAGMHEDVIKMLLKVEANRIVYVSCNPATQARDVALLGGKYEVKAIQPVDMFPHTYHVENVMLLERK